MELIGPQTYGLIVAKGGYTVISPDNQPHFVSPATKSVPKLYVVSKDSSLIYIGISTQPMAGRLRGGLSANGEHGYHGYAWGKLEGNSRLDVWVLQNLNTDPKTELETIEAEVVLLFRNKNGQWPSGQTEIHFHPSEQFHRECAKKIISSFMGKTD